MVCGAVLAVLMSIGATGCAVGRGPRYAVRRSPHLIFNPAWTGLPPSADRRSAWPSTVVFRQSDELITYQETLIDLQGDFAGSRDYYYRRFNSVRTGVRSR